MIKARGSASQQRRAKRQQEKEQRNNPKHQVSFIMGLIHRKPILDKETA